VVAEHRVLAAGHADVGHAGAVGQGAGEGGGTGGAGDPVSCAVDDQQLLAGEVARDVGGVDPRGQRDRAADLRLTSAQQRGAAAQRVADETDRQPLPGAFGDLLERPLRVAQRGLLRVPAARRVEQAEDREAPAAGAGDPPRDRHHAQHRQLRRADHHVLAAAGAAVQQQHRAGRAGGHADVDQAG